MITVKNGTIFVIDGEKWLYIRYSHRMHILASMERVEPVYFEVGKFWTMKTVDRLLTNEQMMEVLESNPGWKDNKIRRKEQ